MATEEMYRFSSGNSEPGTINFAWVIQERVYEAEELDAKEETGIQQLGGATQTEKMPILEGCKLQDRDSAS